MGRSPYAAGFGVTVVAAALPRLPSWSALRRSRCTDLAADHPHHDAGMSAAVEMCLAAFTAVGAFVAVTAVGLIALGRWRPPLTLGWGGVWLAMRSRLPRARAGPGLLLLLCVSRR